MAACGLGEDYEIGDTSVMVHPQAEPWPDLPEALDLMQQANPDIDWDLLIYIVPRWLPVGDPGQACIFRPGENRITARDIGDSTADSCLPHEIAHQCATEHNATWETCRQNLEQAARQTWLHR